MIVVFDPRFLDGVGNRAEALRRTELVVRALRSAGRRGTRGTLALPRAIAADLENWTQYSFTPPFTRQDVHTMAGVLAKFGPSANVISPEDFVLVEGRVRVDGERRTPIRASLHESERDALAFAASVEKRTAVAMVTPRLPTSHVAKGTERARVLADSVAFRDGSRRPSAADRHVDFAACQLGLAASGVGGPPPMRSRPPGPIDGLMHWDTDERGHDPGSTAAAMRSILEACPFVERVVAIQRESLRAYVKNAVVTDGRLRPTPHDGTLHACWGGTGKRFWNVFRIRTTARTQAEIAAAIEAIDDVLDRQ